ncbi:MAG: GtrA family protein [Anaerolineaceae bacterium]
MTSSPKTETERFMRFVLVGLVNTIVDFGILNLLAGLFRLQLMPSQVVSFIASVITSFFLSRKFVYPEAIEGQVSNQLPKFLTINLIGLGVRSLIIPWLNSVFLGIFANTHILNLTTDFISRNLAWAISTWAVLLINFFGNRAWTFRTASSKEKA